MIMGHFTNEEQVEILEFARIAMADIDITADICKKMDINPNYIIELSDKVIEVMEDKKKLMCWDNIKWLRAYVEYVQSGYPYEDKGATTAADNAIKT